MSKSQRKTSHKKRSEQNKSPSTVRYDVSNIDLCSLIKEGLPYDSFENLVTQGQLSADELNYFIPARTLARRKQSKKLSQTESDMVARLSIIFAFAKEIFGSKEKAQAWLRQPNKALKGQKPLALLSTSYGTKLVESILGRIEYGVYS